MSSTDLICSIARPLVTSASSSCSAVFFKSADGKNLDLEEIIKKGNHQRQGESRNMQFKKIRGSLEEERKGRLYEPGTTCEAFVHYDEPFNKN